MSRTAGPGSRSLQLADLCIPWSFEPHPRSAEIHERTRRRCVAFEVMTTEDEIAAFDAFVDCCTHVFPIGDVERVAAASDWIASLWFLDDSYDDDIEFVKRPGAVERLMSRMLALWNTGRLPASPTPLERFTGDLRARLLRLSRGDAGWFARFLDSVESYLFRGSLVTATNYATSRILDVSEYAPIRERDTSVYACLDMVELVNNSYLPAPIVADRRIQRMRCLTARVVAFVNDLVSYEKEVLRKQNPTNLLAVLMHHRGLDFDGARSAAVATINRDVEEFCRLEKRLGGRKGAIPHSVRRYVAGMKHWMSGNLDWSRRSARYCSPDSPFPELRSSG